MIFCGLIGKTAIHNVFPGFVVNFFIFIELAFVVLGDFSYNLAGISRRYAPIGNIFGYNAAGTDNGVAANANAGANNGVAANPDVVTYCYFLAVFIAGVACGGINWVARSINCNVGG